MSHGVRQGFNMATYEERARCSLCVFRSHLRVHNEALVASPSTLCGFDEKLPRLTVTQLLVLLLRDAESTGVQEKSPLFTANHGSHCCPSHGLQLVSRPHRLGKGPKTLRLPYCHEYMPAHVDRRRSSSSPDASQLTRGVRRRRDATGGERTRWRNYLSTPSCLNIVNTMTRTAVAAAPFVWRVGSRGCAKIVLQVGIACVLANNQSMCC